jgi:hypothetical protein
MNIKNIIGAVLLTFGLIGSAQASFIQGQLDIGGTADIVREDGKYVSIDYLEGPDAPYVAYATGDYAAANINRFDAVSVLDPINFLAILLPVTIWGIGDFEFSLEMITVNDGTTVGGRGTISAAGFDDTDGFWSLTSQGSDNGRFSFSSTTTVPEPSVIALMTLGLFGLGFARRKVRN